MLEPTLQGTFNTFLIQCNLLSQPKHLSKNANTFFFCLVAGYFIFLQHRSQWIFTHKSRKHDYPKTWIPLRPNPNQQNQASHPVQKHKFIIASHQRPTPPVQSFGIVAAGRFIFRAPPPFPALFPPLSCTGETGSLPPFIKGAVGPRVRPVPGGALC